MTMIHPTAVIGDPPESRDFRHLHSPGVKPRIANDATIEAFVTVDAGIRAATWVGRGAWLMKHVHVGHDAWIGPDCELAPHTVIGGHALLERGVRCGIGALILPWRRIGEGARIGAGAVVTKDVPAGEVWAGNPARPLPGSRATGEQLTELEEIGWDEIAESDIDLLGIEWWTGTGAVA